MKLLTLFGSVLQYGTVKENNYAIGVRLSMAENPTENPFLGGNAPEVSSAPVQAGAKTTITNAAASAASQATSTARPLQSMSVAPGDPVQTVKTEDEGRLAAMFEWINRMKWILAGVVLLLLLAGGGIWWWMGRSVQTEPVAEQPTPNTPTPGTTKETAPSAAAPPTVDVPTVVLEDQAMYRSENFKAGEVVLLGEAEFLSLEDGVAPLTLDSIRGEAFTEKNKKEVKLVITWKTNKLSRAVVSYAKGLGQTPKMVTEEDFAYNHSLILTGLDPASTYLYTVAATSRSGEVAKSEPYAVFTGARSVSLFDLIAGAIGDVFGWAVK